MQIYTRIRFWQYWGVKYAFITIGVAMVTSAGIAKAGNWQTIPQVGLKATWDDNPELSVAKENAGFAESILAGLKIGSLSERSSISGQISGVIPLAGEEEVETERYDASLSSLHRTERSQFKVNAAYRRDSTIRTDIEAEEEVEGLEDVDAGLITEAIPRHRITFRPSLDIKLSEHTVLGVGYFGKYINYKGGEIAGLVDYEDHKVQTTISHVDAKKGRRSLRLEAEDYRPLNEGHSERSYAFLLSRIYTISKRKSVGIGIGYRYNEGKDETGEQRSDSGLRLSLEQRHGGETHELRWTIARETVPSATGTTVEKDSLNVRFNKKTSTKTRFQLGGRVVKSSRLQGDVDDRLSCRLNRGSNGMLPQA